MIEEHNEVIVSIQDTGIGIAKGDQERIFDRVLMQSLQRRTPPQRAASLLSRR